MSDIKTLGIDLAKNVFQLHGLDSEGKCMLRKRVSRDRLIEYLAQVPPCLIGIEASGGANYWARVFMELGHEVKMIAPQFVKPFIKFNKNDRNDAEGIAKAVSRPEMKFIPIKTREQQDIQMIHRARELLVKQRTAQSNQIRGFLLESGIAIPIGISQIKKLPTILDDHKNQLSVIAERILNQLYEQFKYYDAQIKVYDKQLEEISKTNPQCHELTRIEGVGPLIATAAVAVLGDASTFKNGREMAAWLGLVPKQHSSGNKIKLSGISKRGDRYLRTLLIQGARSAMQRCENKTDKKSRWVTEKKKRKGSNIAAVALANKNARIIGALLKTGACYQQQHRV